MKLPLRTLLAVAGLALLLFACSPRPELPADAEQALLAYWQSLPSSPEVTNEITRAWPGDLEAADLPAGTEVWCVEAQISAPNPDVDGQALVWLVVKAGSESPWTASLLAAMSSTWPYEACGE